MNTAIIAVGSNIEPEKNISRTKLILSKEQRFISESRFIKTAPEEFSDQPDFINGAFKIQTKLDCQQLKEYLRKIEDLLKRERTSNKNGPRTIDLDITVFNGRIVDQDFERYYFVRESVLELEPELLNRGRRSGRK